MAGAQPGAFFAPAGADLAPSPEARSPWSADMLHGRLLAGLAARAVESEQSAEGFRMARLTVDLFRFPPMKPVRVSTRTVRAGGRVRVADVNLEIEGVEVARASAVMLRQGDPPGGTVWAPDPWTVPHPDQVEPPPPQGDRAFPMDLRPISPGGFGALVQKRMWAREVLSLVEGEEPSPWVRLASVADLANPLANSGEAGLAFINSDITVYAARPPRGEWIGVEVASHMADSGVAVASCNLYDLDGSIGHCGVCSVATPRLETG